MQALKSIKDLFKHRNFLGLHFFVTDGLRILGVLVGFQNFVTHFFNGVLFQNVMHIDDPLILGNAHVALDILSSCVAH